MITALPVVGALLLGGAAISGEAAVVERLRWEVSTLGVVVGEASYVRQRGPAGAELLVGRARSARWYRPVYDLDDEVRSHWSPPEGSRRYVTRFREGSFHQDLDILLGPEEIVTRRAQRREGGWEQEEERSARPEGPVEDPLSAMQAVRGLSLEPGGAHHLEVFDGRRVITLRAEVGPVGGCGGRWAQEDCVTVILSAVGDPEGPEIRLRLTRDAAAIPVEAELRKGSLRVRATLTEREVGGE